jgi:hypothetical protein
VPFDAIALQFSLVSEDCSMNKLRRFLIHVVAGALIISLVALVKLLKAGGAIGGGEALALFGVCGLAGGLAGAAHFFSHPLIRKSRLAAYLHGTIVCNAYLFGVSGCLIVTDRLFPAAADPKLREVLSLWWFYAALGITGVIAGIYWGHRARNDFLAEQLSVKGNGNVQSER